MTDTDTLAAEPTLAPARDERAELLQELVESEHQLRHPEAFAALCADLGFRVVEKPHRLEVEWIEGRR